MNRVLAPAVLLLVLSPAACGDDDGGGSHPDAAQGQGDATASDAAFPDAGGENVLVHNLNGRIPGNALLVAAQDGDLGWQLLEGTDGEYSFTTTGRFGVMIACAREDGGATLYFTFATTDDFTEVWGNCNGDPDPTGDVEVTMTGLDSNDSALASFVFGGRGMTQSVPSTTFTDIPVGTQEMFISVRNGTNPANRFYLIRDIAVTDGGLTHVALDEGDDLPTETVNVDFSGASGPDTSYYGIGLITEHRTQGSLRSGTTGNGQLVLPILTAAAIADAELHTVTYEQRSDDNFIQRQAQNYVHAAAAQSLVVPPALDIALSAGEDAPYLRPHLAVTAQEPVQVYTGYMSQNGTPDRQINWVFTDDWLDGDDIAWTIPDLSDLAGWESDWALVDATEISFAGFAFSTSAPSALPYFISGPYDLPATLPDWDGRVDTRSLTIGRFAP